MTCKIKRDRLVLAYEMTELMLPISAVARPSMYEHKGRITRTPCFKMDFHAIARIHNTLQG